MEDRQDRGAMWFPLSTTYYMDPRIIGLPANCEVLFLRLLMMSRHLGSRGVLTRTQAKIVAQSIHKGLDAVDRLLGAGLLEVVRNSRSTGNVQRGYGGASSSLEDTYGAPSGHLAGTYEGPSSSLERTYKAPRGPVPGGNSAPSDSVEDTYEGAEGSGQPPSELTYRIVDWDHWLTPVDVGRDRSAGQYGGRPERRTDEQADASRGRAYGRPGAPARAAPRSPARASFDLPNPSGVGSEDKKKNHAAQPRRSAGGAAAAPLEDQNRGGFAARSTPEDQPQPRRVLPPDPADEPVVPLSREESLALIRKSISEGKAKIAARSRQYSKPPPRGRDDDKTAFQNVMAELARRMESGTPTPEPNGNGAATGNSEPADPE